MSLTEYKVLDLNETICQKPLTSTLKVREKLNIHGNSTSGKITFKSTTIQCKFDFDFQFEKNKHERMMKNYHGMEWSQQLAYQMMYM